MSETQREVALKLSVKNPEGARPIKELSDATKAMAGDEKAYQKLLKERLDAYKLATRLKEDMARAGIGREMSEEEKYQKMLKERIAAYQTAKRLKHDLARSGVERTTTGELFGGVSAAAGVMGFALPTSALAAFAATIKAADFTLKTAFASVERGQFNPTSFRLRAQQSFENNVPFYGELARHMPWKSGEESTVEREFRVFLAQQGIGVAGQRARISGERAGGVGSLRTGVYGGLADLQTTLGLRRELHGITSGAIGARDVALSSITGAMGYGRAEQTEDVLRQIAFRQQFAGIGATGAAQVGSINAKLREAEGQERFYRERYDTTRQAERLYGDTLRRHIQGGGTVQVENVLRNQLSAAAAERQHAEEQLMQAQRQSLELRQQREQTILRTQEQQHAALRQQVETVSQLRQAERQRLQGLQESLGLMHPMQLRTAVGISRKIKAGMPLTQREIEYMGGHRDIFGSQLQQIGAQRATSGPFAGMIQELIQNTGQGARLAALEKQEIALRNEINVNVNVDESIVDQWEKQVLPKFFQAVEQLKQAMNNRLAELENQRLAQQRTQHPQF